MNRAFIADRKTQRPDRGFTLLEMLLAISIFAIVSLAAWQMLSTVSRAREVQLDNEKRLHEIDYAFLLIKQDIRQLIDRGVRTGKQSSARGLSVYQTSNSAAPLLSLVRAGWRNTDNLLPRSHLQRVYYRWHNQKLQRAYDPILDKPSSYLPEFRTLINQVSSLSFLFYHEGRWQEQLSPDIYPQGIAIQLEIENYGTVERRFLIPAQWDGDDNG